MVKTTAGPLELERPRVRNASSLQFCSAIVGKGVTRTSALCLIWAVLELSSRGWRSVVMTPQAVAESNGCDEDPRASNRPTRPRR